MRLTLAAALILATFFPACIPAHATGGAMALAETMAPHKALYAIEMVSRRNSVQVLNISGRMFYEWKPSCEAWTTDHRFNLFYEYADTPPIRITSDFSTYEPFDGRSFDFTSRRRRNGALYEEIRGRAEKQDDGTGAALYTLPPDLRFALAAGTLFPTAHSLEVLKAVRTGKKFYNAAVFDGSDEEGPVEINSFIGPMPAGAVAPAGPDIDADLLRAPAHRIRMAFFPLSGTESDAEYEMDVVYHENGIISDMHVDYRDFAVRQTLLALEKIVPPECRPERKEKTVPGEKRP